MVTEQEFLRALDIVVRMLSKSLAFGYFAPEDIAQEAAIFGWRALSRYDPGPLRPDGTPSRPLANFLYRHIKFRLLNLKRKLYRRSDAPCPLCRNGQEYYHEDGRVCTAHRLWELRNARKASLCAPRWIDAESEEAMPRSPDVVGDVELRELWSLVDERLPVELRAGEMIPPKH